MRHTVCAFLLALSIAFPVCSQVSNASISGTVTDSSGAYVPGATISVRNINTGVTATATTDASGLYSAPNLIIGTYEVHLTKKGFASEMRSGITLTVGRQAVVDFTIKPGNTSEQIVVTADAPLVETANSALGGLIDQKQVRELPLNGRNLQQLILLAPGVNQVNADGVPGTYTHGNSSTFSVAGLRPVGMTELLDGADVSNFYKEGAGNTTANTSLGAEAVAEFQTLTNTYSAEFGGQGAVINEATRSGTNAFHASGYWFYRDSYFNALNYVFPFQGSNQPSFHKIQYGATAAGPIRKDKTFFFLNYEGLSQAIGQSQAGTTLDTNARLGYVPCRLSAATACNSTNGLTYVGVSPNMARVLPFFPIATGASIAGTGTAFFTGSDTTTVDEKYATARIDHRFSDRDSLFGSYVVDTGNTFAISLPVTGYGSIEFGRNQYLTLQENHVVSPTLVNVADLHFVRLNQQISPQTLGAQAPALDFFGGSYAAGYISAPGLSTVGGGTILKIADDKFTWSDHVYWTVGKHALKVGLDVNRTDANVYEPLLGGGVWTFPSLIGLLQASPSAVSGPAPGSGDAERGFRETEILPFIQDDYKVNARLTLNLGLRYEFATNIREVNNKFWAVVHPLTDTTYTQVPNAFLTNPSLKNFDPRIGFAWTPFSSQGTVIRGGFGIFHNVLEARDVLSYAYNYPYVFTALNTYSGVPGQKPIPFPNINPVSIFTPSANLTPYYLNTKTPYAMEYNFNIQQELFRRSVLTIGYVGSSSVHLPISYNLNANTPAGTVNGQFYRPYNDPRVHPLNPAAGTLLLETFDSNSHYNALQASLRQQIRSAPNTLLLYVRKLHRLYVTAVFG